MNTNLLPTLGEVANELRLAYLHGGTSLAWKELPSAERARWLDVAEASNISYRIPVGPVEVRGRFYRISPTNPEAIQIQSEGNGKWWSFQNTRSVRTQGQIALALGLLDGDI